MQGALQVNIGKTSARQNDALVFPVLGCFVLYIICAFGQRRPPCINTRTRHERALNAIAKRVSRGSKTLRGCRAAPCWGQGAKPLGFPQSTREHSMKKRSTQSRERVKGGTPLWGQGAKPLGFPQSTRGKSMKERSTQSRERVKGGTPLWGQGAKPLGFPQSTRGKSMKERSTQSRERVKGGTPLRSPEAEPLAPPPHSTSCVFMETVKRTLSPSQ